MSTLGSPLLPTSADGWDAQAVRNPLAGPELSDADFAAIAAIAYREAGLAIAKGKSAMVRTRLARRLRALGLASFAAYRAHIESPDGADEIGMLVSSLTTNVSHFFREEHHFETLRSRVLPPLVARAEAGQKVRIWSAGCANGQEPYSIAMAMIEAGMPLDRDVRVLATDIDPNVVDRARSGLYPETMLTGLPDALRKRHFSVIADDDGTHWQIGDHLRSAVAFRVLNLLEDWPMRGRFDAIFCRNVVIYFDAETQSRLWQRFANQLVPGGWLFLGHSERLSAEAQALFEGRGITTYQRASLPDRLATGKSALTKGR